MWLRISFPSVEFTTPKKSFEEVGRVQAKTLARSFRMFALLLIESYSLFLLLSQPLLSVACLRHIGRRLSSTRASIIFLCTHAIVHSLRQCALQLNKSLTYTKVSLLLVQLRTFLIVYCDLLQPGVFFPWGKQ